MALHRNLYLIGIKKEINDRVLILKTKLDEINDKMQKVLDDEITNLRKLTDSTYFNIYIYILQIFSFYKPLEDKFKLDFQGLESLIQE